MNIELWTEIYKLVSDSKYSESIQLLETIIIESAVCEFQPLVGVEISDPESVVVAQINKFKSHCEKQFEVKSIYLEMNGFDINYDRWYFDFFAYDTYSEDREDPEWLCDWKSDDWPDFTIHGLKPAQKVFEWYHENEIWNERPDVKNIYEAAMLLVMVKFIDFVSTVIESKDIGLPILATAHGFETIGYLRS